MRNRRMTSKFDARQHEKEVANHCVGGLPSVDDGAFKYHRVYQVTKASFSPSSSPPLRHELDQRQRRGDSGVVPVPPLLVSLPMDMFPDLPAQLAVASTFPQVAVTGDIELFAEPPSLSTTIPTATTSTTSDLSSSLLLLLIVCILFLLLGILLVPARLGICFWHRLCFLSFTRSSKSRRLVFTKASFSPSSSPPLRHELDQRQRRGDSGVVPVPPLLVSLPMDMFPDLPAQLAVASTFPQVAVTGDIELFAEPPSLSTTIPTATTSTTSDLSSSLLLLLIVCILFLLLGILLVPARLGICFWHQQALGM
ncbi:hypothetical protein EGR_06741 [Echinococcus granulosus]|uniref:Uncharacterized protein n=1 Tax=Echinococcus granulosus TaxID=6210 RepID=W6UY21_ECHGR|nr:hypothetical protein EGR_06741 [Echinococcus granulosus]EUB58454.1 hypothetical protein EGR_06741 [Echinococcus granulosus]